MHIKHRKYVWRKIRRRKKKCCEGYGYPLNPGTSQHNVVVTESRIRSDLSKESYTFSIYLKKHISGGSSSKSPSLHVSSSAEVKGKPNHTAMTAAMYGTYGESTSETPRGIY